VGDWAYQQATMRDDLSVELVDLKDWNLPMFDFPKPPIMGDYENPLQQRWADKIAQGDGYIFVSPEYNHGYTPVLKNALDYLYAEWAHKPASFITYGGVNGARSVEQVRLVLVELRMVPIRNAVHLPNLRDKFNDGQFVGDKADSDNLTQVLDDLVRWDKVLQELREVT